MTQPKINLTVTQLKKHLKSLTHKELVDIIAGVYKFNREARNFIASRIMGEEVIDVLQEHYKKIITNEFFPDRGFGKLRLSVAKKAISDFKKICNDEERIMDLMTHYVEMGVEFTCTYGDINEAFYNSVESVFANIIEMLGKVNDEKIIEKFQPRLKAIVYGTGGIGWGFHDYLSDLYDEFFEGEV